MSGTYKQFTGIAPVAHLTGGGIVGSPSTFSVDNASGFPTGAGGVPFVVCVNRNQANEEKILCSAEATNVFTIQTRGWDGTPTGNHNASETVEHVIDADTMNDLEQHVHVPTRFDHDAQYGRLDGTNQFTGAVTFQAGIDVSGNTVDAGNVSATGDLAGEYLTVSGLPGATSGARFVGATASGPPTTGTFLTGDYVVDQTGTMIVCTSGGSPGTWVRVGASYVAHAVGPNSNIDSTNATSSVLTVAPTLVSGGKYLVHARALGLIVTNNIEYCDAQLGDSSGYITPPTGGTLYMGFLGANNGSSVVYQGAYMAASATAYMTATASGTDTISILFSSIGSGTLRSGPNTCELTVVRIA